MDNFTEKEQSIDIAKQIKFQPFLCTSIPPLIFEPCHQPPNLQDKKNSKLFCQIFRKVEIETRQQFISIRQMKDLKFQF